MKNQPPTLLQFDRNFSHHTRIQNSILSLLFPWTCPGCHRLLPYPSAICNGCADRLKRIEPPFCKKCGSPYPAEWKVQICPECRTQKSAITMVRSVYYYEQLIQKMVLEIKYAGRARYLHYLSDVLVQHAISHLPRFEVIVPVPLHRQREWERNFNQAELLANQLSRRMGIRVWKILRKPKKTLPQSSLSGTARRCNLKGAFECRQTKASYGSALLIDDVITTGATLQECAQVLRKSTGIRRVYALTIARAVQQF
jgi:ComF family protein